MEACDEAFGVSLGERVSSADLDGSSNIQMRTLKTQKSQSVELCTRQ